MFVVMFEAQPKEGRRQDYVDAAASLRSELEAIEGFISIEGFESMERPGRLVAISHWHDEDAVKRWRDHNRLHLAQLANRDQLLVEYRITIAEIEQQYGTV